MGTVIPGNFLENIPMSLSKKVLIPLAVACIGSPLLHAGESCETELTRKWRDSARIVDVLRPEKAGQLRVFAADGSEFTAGQVMWMKGQLRLVERACARGDQADAARLLTQVRDLIEAHRRAL
jgi:hypothetical protein